MAGALSAVQPEGQRAAGHEHDDHPLVGLEDGLQQLLLQSLEADVRLAAPLARLEGVLADREDHRRRPTRAASTAAGMPERSVVLMTDRAMKLRGPVTSFTPSACTTRVVDGTAAWIPSSSDTAEPVTAWARQLPSGASLSAASGPDHRDRLRRLVEGQQAALVLEQHDRLARHVAGGRQRGPGSRAPASRAPRRSSGTGRRRGRARTSPAGRAGRRRPRASRPPSPPSPGRRGARRTPATPCPCRSRR